MGNGALPHGPSYRAHPRLYLSGGGQGVGFTSAFGGAAEVHGPTASAAFDANDYSDIGPNLMLRQRSHIQPLSKHSSEAKGGNFDNSDRVQPGHRPGQARPRRKSQPTER
jgi:hypothetical protein